MGPLNLTPFMKVSFIVAIAVLSTVLTLSSCTSVPFGTATNADNAVVKITDSVQSYCAVLEIGSGIAAALDKKTIAQQINAGVTEYCNKDIAVSDVPTAIVKLAAVYKSAIDAGVPLNDTAKIQMAAN